MRNRHRVALAVLTAAGLGLAVPASAQKVPSTMPAKTQLSGQEQHPTVTITEVKPHWVYLVDIVLPHLIASKVYVVDGDTLQFVGMLNTGYLPNLVLSHDKSALYVAETYWSRGARGERSDMVTLYDPKTFEVTGEVPIKGRFLVVTKKPNAAITPDGRYLLSFNMDPSTSVSLVDVKEKKHIGEIETPGCAHVFPTGNMSFAMLCADGSFATIGFDATGGAKIRSGEPFFDSEKDPVFEHAAMHRPSGKAFFVSYGGTVYPVDFSTEQPTIGEKWQLQGQGDEGWRPGGWQLATYHAATNRLFVVMHEGGPWTHKEAGGEIWVYDTNTKKRVQRITVPHKAFSIAVTQDDKPLLFSESEEGTLSVFDGTTYEHKGDKEHVSETPTTLSVFGE